MIRNHLRAGWLTLGLLLSIALSASGQEPADTVGPDSIPADTIPQELLEARATADSAQVVADTIRSMVLQFQTASSADQQVIQVRGVRPVEEFTRLVGKVATFLFSQPDSAAGVGEIKASLQSGVSWSFELYSDLLQEHRQALREINERRLSLERSARGPVHAESKDRQDRLQRILEYQLRTLLLADSAGLEAGDQWAALDAELLDRAPNLVGQVQLALEEQSQARRDLRQSVRAGVEGEGLASVTLAADEATNWTRILSDALTGTADLLDQRGQNTAQYRQLVIRATGAVTEEILDFDVLWGLALDYGSSFLDWLKENLGDLAIKLLIILGMIAFFKYGIRSLWWFFVGIGWMGTSKAAKALGSRLVGPLGVFAGLVFGLYLIGVAPTFLLAGLGVVGVVLGLALQDSVSNVAAGAFILFDKPFDLDDKVVLGGVSGRVQGIGLASTTVKTYDHRLVTVPNRKVWGEAIENGSAEEVRRADATVAVTYEDDMARIHSSLCELLQGMELVVDEPEFEIYVNQLADSGVELSVRCWATNDNWWALQSELPGQIWAWFQKNDIEIPYPRRHIISPGIVEALAGEEAGSETHTP